VTVVDQRLVVVLVSVGLLALAGSAVIFGPAEPPEVGSRDPGAGTPTPGAPPFSLSIDRLAECGSTCRDVTLTLRNDQARTATEVGVTSTIYAGRTTDGTVVWTGYEYVGELGAGESFTTTRQVDLSLRQGLAIRNADGYILIETTIEYDDKVVTFTRERRVV